MLNRKSFLIKDILDEESSTEETTVDECVECLDSYLNKTEPISWPSLHSSAAFYGIERERSLYGLYCASLVASSSSRNHFSSEIELNNNNNNEQQNTFSNNIQLDSELNSRKVRRNRTVFTELQLMGLERRFDSQKYLSTPDRADLARALGLTQLQVKTWYQNRRMKWKKQVMQNGILPCPTKPKGRPKKNSIPSFGISLSESNAILSAHVIQQSIHSSFQQY